MYCGVIGGQQYRYIVFELQDAANIKVRGFNRCLQYF